MDELFNRVRAEAGLPNEIDLSGHRSIIEVFLAATKEHAHKPAFTSFGCTLTFDEVRQQAENFASYIQNHTSLKPGDRIAVQLPNILQYPVAVFGSMLAGLVIVNTNPLYTAREMLHQFNDSGATALVVFAGMASLAEEVVPKTSIKHVIVTEVADLHPIPKRWVLNFGAKYLKKMVPAYSLPDAISINKALQLGRQLRYKEVKTSLQDVAVLQYTGGTTGVAKGAMLTHRNIIANMLQAEPNIESVKADFTDEVVITPLPLYHIYAFTVHCMVCFSAGQHSVLIANPRDMPTFIKILQQHRIGVFTGLNTLFVGLMNNPDFAKLDFSSLKLTMSGGMALTIDAAKRWAAMTGCDVYEGYGMTETSPIVSANPYEKAELGTVGIPVASTSVKVIDAEGKDLPVGEAGELCVKGPQVMKGYWQRPEATADVMIGEDWLKTGDMAIIQENGYIRLVDRKKDMVIVSGFNVYPNEIENILTEHPAIIEAAVIGVPDEKSGEAVKAFIVASDKSLTVDSVKAHCRENLTGYKVPKHIEFMDELPKSNVGKVLRRMLRDDS